MLLFLYLSPKCTFSGNSFTSNFTGFFFSFLTGIANLCLIQFMLLFLYLSPKCAISGNYFTSNFTGFFFSFLTGIANLCLIQFMLLFLYLSPKCAISGNPFVSNATVFFLFGGILLFSLYEVVLPEARKVSLLKLSAYR